MKTTKKILGIVLSISLSLSFIFSSFPAISSYCWVDEWEIPTSEGEGLGYKYALNEAITHDALALIAAFAIGDGSASGHAILDTLKVLIGTFQGRWYNKYNYKKSVQIFCDNPWPYDLQKTEDMDYPLVGHVLANDENYEKAKTLLRGNYKGGDPIEVLDSFRDEAYDPEYDDINYAEILTIMSDNHQFDYKNSNLLDFSDRLLLEENRKFYYELKLRWVAVLCVDIDVDGDGIVEESERFTRETEEFADFEEMVEFVNAVVEDREEFLIPTPVGEEQATDLDEFYINSYLKPFGLRDVWALAIQTDDNLKGQVSIDEFAFYMDNMYYQGEISGIHMSNMELLDEQERWLRIMTRFDDESILDHRETASEDYKQDLFGPSYKEERSELSTIYEDLLNDETTMRKYGRPTGRSLWEFFPWEDCYNLKDVPKSLMDDEDYFMSAPSAFGMTEEEFLAFIASLPPEAFVNGYQYINQGRLGDLMRGNPSWGKTFKGSGCCDSSYMMIAAAFLGITLTNAEIANIARNTDFYTRNAETGSVLFRGNVFLDYMSRKYGDGKSLHQTGGNKDYNPSAIISELDKGNPVIFHIRGHWEDPRTGRVYHSSDGGHFLTISGYDNRGFYVNDPGSSANTTNGPIPYEAFGNYGVYDMYYRTFEFTE